MRLASLLLTLTLWAPKVALASDPIQTTMLVYNQDFHAVTNQRVADDNVCIVSLKTNLDKLVKDPEVKQALEEFRVVSHRAEASILVEIKELHSGGNDFKLSVVASNPNFNDNRPTDESRWGVFPEPAPKPGIFASRKTKKAYEESERQRAIANRAFDEYRKSLAKRQADYDAANGKVVAPGAMKAVGKYEELLDQGLCGPTKAQILSMIRNNGSTAAYQNELALAECQADAKRWKSEYEQIQKKIAQVPSQWFADIIGKLTPSSADATDSLAACQARVADLTAVYSNYSESVHLIANQRRVAPEALEVPLDPLLNLPAHTAE